MSINRNKQKYELKRATSVTDDYGQEVASYSVIKNIEVALYKKEQKVTENNPLYVETTHIGITTYSDIHKTDKIGSYEVLDVNSNDRLTTLLLKEV